MQAIRAFILIILLIFSFEFLSIVLPGMFELLSLAVPNDKTPEESINEGIEEASRWFRERSGKSDAQHDADMRAAGLFYNNETGRYEENPYLYEQYLNERFGRNN